MRSVLLACAILVGISALLFLGLVPVSVQVQQVSVGCAQAQAQPTPARPDAPAPSGQLRKKTREESYRAIYVEGDAMVSPEDAKLDALVRVQLELENYLRTLDPPIYWKPPLEYIRKRFAKESAREVGVEIKDDETRLIVSSLGQGNELKRVVINFEITPQVHRELLYLARQDRSETRMAWLLPLFGGVVLLLLATSTYIHLDEQTKGYYTGWLRLAAGGTIAAVLASSWWFCTQRWTM